MNSWRRDRTHCCRTAMRRRCRAYDGAVPVIAAFVAGSLFGLGVTALLVRQRRQRPDESLPGPRSARARARETVPAETVLEQLPTAAAVVDATGTVTLANRAA